MLRLLHTPLWFIPQERAGNNSIYSERVLSYQHKNSLADFLSTVTSAKAEVMHDAAERHTWAQADQVCGHEVFSVQKVRGRSTAHGEGAVRWGPGRSPQVYNPGCQGALAVFRSHLTHNFLPSHWMNSGPMDSLPPKPQPLELVTDVLPRARHTVGVGGYTGVIEVPKDEASPRKHLKNMTSWQRIQTENTSAQNADA